MVDCACSDGISIFPGRDYTAKITLTIDVPVPSTPLDLTGALLWLSVKDETSDSDADALILKRNTAAGGDDTEILIMDATNGDLEVYFVPDDTNGWSEGDYWFDLVVETSSIGRKQAVPPSCFHVGYTITKVDI
jgi:hypothetical protein